MQVRSHLTTVGSITYCPTAQPQLTASVLHVIDVLASTAFTDHSARDECKHIMPSRHVADWT